MKKTLLITPLLLVQCLAFGQKLSYQQKAEEIKKQVWATPAPGFELKEAPAGMNSESAVVLARYFDLQRTKGSRFKWGASGGTGNVARTDKTTIFRERVKLNDKSSLEEFSTIEYQKRLDNTSHFGVSKLRNTAETFIGIKILKSDGKTIEVDIDEQVLLKDKKDEAGKIAVSNLSVGDIIDYYIATSEITEGYADNYDDNNYVFFLKDEYPVLNYKIHFRYGPNIVVRQMSGNGAPELKITTNSDKDHILTAQLSNLPKHKGLIWSSPYRQFPYISVSGTFVGKGSTREESTLPVVDAHIETLKNMYDARTGVADPEISTKVKDYFGGAKQLKAVPLDSVICKLYDTWKHSLFCFYDGEEMDMSNARNSRTAKSLYNAAVFSQNLIDLKIDHDVLLAASRFSPALDAKKRDTPLETFIRVKGAKPIYLFFNSVTGLYNEIPHMFLGEKAIVLKPDRKNKFETNFTKSETVLPAGSSDENTLSEVLHVSLLNEAPQKVKITRTSKQRGFLRSDVQAHLLLMEDIDRELTALVKGKPLQTRLSKNYITKKMVDDYQAAFEKARLDEKNNFSSEIKEHFDQEPQQLSNYKILNSGLKASAPEFEYTATFVLDNFVKKAGNNYIVEAGKLAGSFLKLDDESRTRTVDVYMSGPRTFQYAINLAVPKGYRVKGLEDLNAEKKNKTGAFSSRAAVEGETLRITISRSYTNYFEKAADWPLLAELIEEGSALGLKKVLLEKVN
ncbi:hypothetical protein [Pedobacter sp. SYSU D00535]|uniref:hypothetical protein n=1 Tax=Pedobacter sp. SYSU D00535 TaxID=2810308 RepID=UPI001A97396B|nr:hypothetical protein [Pedobacter sp. SYSU D00535]